MEDFKREHQRVYITFYLRVFEQDRFIGFAVDISDDGIKILSDYQLDSDKDYFLEMSVPPSLKKKDRGREETIQFSATCLWSKHDFVDKEFYLNGFKFIELTDKDRGLLKKLIEEFKNC